jgi:hypothetical protein
MSRSRNRPKVGAAPKIARRRRRWDWRRVAGGGAGFFRNLALLALATPFAEPLLTGLSTDLSRATTGIDVALVLLTFSLILDHERSD